MPGANPVAVWRWELGEMGRDGPTTDPEKVTVVSIQMLGKYRVDATINKENMLQRIHTWVPDPVLGDMNYEHEFTNATYVDAGNGIRFPTVWHHHEGWDDNYNMQTVSAGHNGFGGTFKQVSADRMRRAGPGARRGPRRAAGGARRGAEARGWRLRPGRRVAQQRRGGVPGSHRRRRGAVERGAQPGRDRGNRPAHPEQADPLPREHPPALRSHRRDADLPAHRRDDHHARQELSTSTTATC